MKVSHHNITNYKEELFMKKKTRPPIKKKKLFLPSGGLSHSKTIRHDLPSDTRNWRPRHQILKTSSVATDSVSNIIQLASKVARIQITKTTNVSNIQAIHVFKLPKLLTYPIYRLYIANIKAS